jgi:hypothetical protein
MFQNFDIARERLPRLFVAPTLASIYAEPRARVPLKIRAPFRPFMTGFFGKRPFVLSSIKNNFSD